MTNLKKNKQGYGYKYTDLSAIHDYLESIGYTYTQYTERIEGDDYIYTRKYKDGEFVEELRGCRVVQATLSGKSNPAQEQGSALTYARRYSLLMAFGLATEDDDGESLTRTKIRECISDKLVESLTEAIRNKEYTKGYIDSVLKKYNISSLSEIQVNDLPAIKKELDI